MPFFIIFIILEFGSIIGVEYVEYYWIHGLNGQTYRKAEEMHAFDFLQKKKAEGKFVILAFLFTIRLSF